MPEDEIPLTGDPAVDAAIQRIRGKFKGLEDALLVQVFLENKAGERLKEHAEWLVRHDEAMEQHDVKMREFDEKLNLLIDREMRREGGPESVR